MVKKKKPDWEKRSKLAGMGADLAKMLADASPNKMYSQMDSKTFVSGPVKDNEKEPGMDVTQFSDAYGSRNADTTGEDFGKMSDEERKKKYGF